MITKKVICDRCDHNISEANEDYFKLTLEWRDGVRVFEICKDCKMSFLQSMDEIEETESA